MKIYSIFSLLNILLALIIRSLIHFELIFVDGMRKEPNFIVLEHGYPIAPETFIEDFTFPINGLNILVENQLTINIIVSF
jgi:hypothetical protein